MQYTSVVITLIVVQVEARSPRSPGRSQAGWDEAEWEPIDETGTGTKEDRPTSLFPLI